MKQSVFLTFSIALSLGFTSVSNAQDQLILQSAEEIKVKVLEIGLETITYKDFDNLEGPNIKIPKSDVFLIIYENGKTFKVPPSEKPEDVKPAPTKSLEIDNRVHHILSMFANIPEFRESDFGLLNGASTGFSYEIQSRSKIFGFRIAPTFSKLDYSVDEWIMGLALSPRFFVFNRKPGQIFLGLEGSYGTNIGEDAIRTSTGEDILATATFIVGTHIFSDWGLNGNTELGFGYQYWKSNRGFSSNGRVFRNEQNMFRFFVRLSLGARLKGKP